jgi:DNA invertase Pin-like site-specific DNA recombinase
MSQALTPLLDSLELNLTSGGLEAALVGQRIGYVRVSALDQNKKRQLEGQVLDRVFTDKASGRDTARPELTELLRFARDGDTVIVHSMDRLARNLDDLRALVQGLTRRGVRVEFVKESLVFTGENSPMANLMLSVMGAFAEFERSLITERQKKVIAPFASGPTASVSPPPR